MCGRTCVLAWRPVPFASVLLAAGLVAAAPVDARRWPRWPTEIDRRAAPLRVVEGDARWQDHDRRGALVALDGYATAAIAPWVVHALADPSTEVKREALRICFERELQACLPGAATLLERSGEPSLRVAAMRVLAIDPTGARLDLLLAALRDDNDAIRAQAATIVGWADTQGEARTKVRTALAAKLGDLSALVRQAAIEGLAILGAPELTLTLTRVLDDPEPAVRSAAARALGTSGDRNASAALVRATGAANEPQVVRTAIAALVQLGGADADAHLLSLLDDPPAGLTAGEIAELVGLHADPSPALLAGLRARLRDPASTRAMLRTLVLLGDAALPAIEAELAAGPAPDTAQELARIVAGARAPIRASAGPPRGVGLQGVAADVPWRELVGLPTADAWPRIAARMRRGDRGDRARIDAELRSADAADVARPWLWAAALCGPSPCLARDGGSTAAHLVTLSGDDSARASDRALAVLALAAVDPRGPGRDLTDAAITARLADAEPLVRVAAAVVWTGRVRRLDDRMMIDPDPRVRVAAILAARSRSITGPLRARLADLRARDPSAPVRAAAGFVLASPRAPTARLAYLEGPPAPSGWTDPAAAAWIAVALDDGHRLWLPALVEDGLRFAIAPGLPDTLEPASE